MYVFGFHIHMRFAFHAFSLSLSLSFWFSLQLLTSQLWTVHLCTVYKSHKLHFSEIFSLKMGPTALFTHLKIISLQCFQFQFSISAKIRFIQTDLFLSISNLSFNQLVGLIPYIKLFGTFLEAFLWKEQRIMWVPFEDKCAFWRSPPLTFEDIPPYFGPSIDWNCLSAELGFVFGFGMIIALLYFGRGGDWRIQYF